MTFLPANCRHVIWDWNGTLIDDAALCVAVLNGMLARRGMPPVSLPAYRREFCFPVLHYYRQLGFDLEAETFTAISREYITGYLSGWRACQLHRGARETLQFIGRAGLSQSVLSASHQDPLEAGLRHFGIDACFLHVVGRTDHFAPGKIEQGRDLLSRLPWAPAEILLIGDTLHDAEVAAELGLVCLLVGHGHHSPEVLAGSGCPVLPGFPAPLAAAAEDTAPPSGERSPGISLPAGASVLAV